MCFSHSGVYEATKQTAETMYMYVYHVTTHAHCHGTGVLLKIDLITEDPKIRKLYCIEKSITNNRNTGNKSLYNCTKKLKILLNFNSSKHENILS